LTTENQHEITLKPLYSLGLRRESLKRITSEARFYSKVSEN